MNYDAFGSDYEPGSESTLKVKDELKAFFTIDSITRFVAIENSKQLLDTLSKRITNFQLDEESIASFFPEIELLFFLNGAKYVKGEKYTTSTILPVDGELLECDLEFEMTLFSRQENVFRIECTATPKTVSDQIKDFKYFLIYSFRLSDLFPKSITLQTSYHKGQNKYSSKTEITLN